MEPDEKGQKINSGLFFYQHHRITFAHYHTNSVHIYIISMQLDIVYAIILFFICILSVKRAMNGKVARQKVSRLFATFKHLEFETTI